MQNPLRAAGDAKPPDQDATAIIYAGIAVVLFAFWVLIKLRSPDLEGEKMKRMMRRNFDLETQQGRDSIRQELNSSTGQYKKATAEEKEELFDLLDKLDMARSGQEARQAEVQRRWKLLLTHKQKAEQAGETFKTKWEMQDLMTRFGIRIQRPVTTSDTSRDAVVTWQEFLKDHTKGGVMLLPGKYGKGGEIVGKKEQKGGKKRQESEGGDGDDEDVIEEEDGGDGEEEEGAVEEISGKCDACGRMWTQPVVCGLCDATYYCSEKCMEGGKSSHRKRCQQLQKKLKNA